MRFVEGSRPETVALSYEDVSGEIRRAVDATALWRFPAKWSPAWAQYCHIGRLLGGAYRRRERIGSLLSADNADVVLGLGEGDWFQYSRIPCILWFWDFQHRWLPDMFSEAERVRIDQQIADMEARATIILAMSRSVLLDFQRWHPTVADRVRLVRVPCEVPENVWNGGPSSILEKYGIKPPFVFLPNQLWKHKNHSVVIEATRILQEIGRPVRIVCCGGLNDRRHPSHYGEIVQSIEDSRLSSQIRLLGFIPREDYWSLLRESCLLLNPSLFEGYALSVEEATTLGKPVLASDIPAHREFDAKQVRLFDPTQPSQLAEILWEMLEIHGDTGQQISLRDQRRQWEMRQRKCGVELCEIAQEAYRHGARRPTGRR